MHRTHRHAPPRRLLRALALALAVWLVGCSSLPQPRDDNALQREAVAGTYDPVPAPLPLPTTRVPDAASAVRPQLNQGSGQFIRPSGLATPRASAAGPQGVTFNFENQPVQAVVKAILGDLLNKNYTIVPGVQGNISFSTAEPVDTSEALPILETLLSWTGNALVQRGGSYVVLPAKDALGGNLVPSLGASAPQGGLQARLFPLRYISATEMQKLIKPFARPDSILLVDPARNLLVMSGTSQELANYQRTVRTFDVDWLRGMSVGVFSLQRASVGELMPKLDSMFGPKGDTPLAGMLRFIPIERTNALVVISTQPDYLREVGDWIARIDRGGGNEPQLFVYDVRNIKASDLARYLAQIYTNASPGGGGNSGEVGPGLTAGTLGNADNANGTAMGGASGSLGSSGYDNGTGTGGANVGGGFGDSGGLANATSAANDQQFNSSDGSIRISSVDANNQLLVRARPTQWSEIETAIKRLDTVPLQVQIETRILEVQLTGQFQFGVQWYLEGLAGGAANSSGGINPGQPGNRRQWALGKGGMIYNPTGDSFFYSFLNNNLQVALHAQEENGNVKTLSAPSLVVMNNQVARIQAGDQIPVNQTYFTPGLGSVTNGAPTTIGQVQYISTGVILDVQPRINPGGLVYLNIKQQVSVPGTKDANGNYTIQQREISTKVGVQSGQTVLLGGLIRQDEGNTDTGIPGLNRIPLVGRLFGSTDRHRNRSELIVLITPRVIGSSEDARRITDEYQAKFESLAPLRAERARQPPPPAASPADVPLPRPPMTPGQLTDQAAAALARADYATAQRLALESWRNGPQDGELCARNWQLIASVRTHLGDTGGAETARRWMTQCMAGGK
ncbi:type II secretion system protein GspD [Rhodanobacter sp. Root627]|uniref:type II secretion system secretin GspD n=1 Tax=Rhodanobacter sp. Root627 TaxID=1736572 RepID=UPI0006FE0359|nr:type II secretion system secretin GspD [Rhodanobacter sp. Root627]KRA33453.1 type II secretion system protein GspD [Rhodanobacter sp. Root627]